jgi:hypothetical protein
MTVPMVRRPAPRDVVRGIGRTALGRGAEELLDPAWPVAHAAMGASLGVIYQGCRRFLPGGTKTAGATFGAAAWAALYAGLLPALGVYPSPRRDSRLRAARVAALHILYGVSLGWFDSRLTRR